MFRVRFRAAIWRYEGKGGWYFVTVPADRAPSARGGWGRSAVRAIVGGVAWSTSVWRGKDGRTLLPLPKRIRDLDPDRYRAGARITVDLEF